MSLAYALGTQATLGALFGISLMINIMFVVVVLVLLIKPRAKCIAKQSSPFSNEKKDKGVDMETEPNKLYALTRDTIETRPNKVYGVSSPTEQSQPVTYEYVDP